MSLLLKILQIIGLILLAIIALLVWLIIVPRHFWVEYCDDDGLSVKMNIAFFKLRLFPLPKFIEKRLEKAAETAEADEEKALEEEAEAQEKAQESALKKSGLAQNLEFSFDLVKDILSAAGGAVKILLRGIKFSSVSFTVPLQGEDAYSTQKLYAKVTTAFYALNIFLQKYMRIYYKSPMFVADFAGRHSKSTYFYCKISASPGVLLSVAFYGFKQYKRIMKNNQKTAAAAADIKEK